MHILVINGPSLQLLGVREPEIYGQTTYQELCDMIYAHAKDLHITVEILQSNHEGDLVDWIDQAYGKADGIVLNPAAYTHTSVALLDAVKATGIPTVEVHISDVNQREDFRQVSYVRSACVASIIGHGCQGYLEAMDRLVGAK